jgi:nitroreductase
MTMALANPMQAFPRQPEHDVLPLFVNRWSPRAFKPEPVPRAILDAMVEAARWAPSSINLQPWRFHLTTMGETRDAWNQAVGERNRTWSDHAGALVWVVAKTTMGPNPFAPPETPNRHAHFDTGAAAVQFVLEGERHGVKSHYMGGVDVGKAHQVLGLAADEDVVCAIAVGYTADPSTLPDGLRNRETPSGRKPAPEIARFA